MIKICCSILLALVGLIAILAGAVFWQTVMLPDWGHPSRETLLENFNQHQTELESLRTLSKEDGLSYLGSTIDTGLKLVEKLNAETFRIPASRFNQYLQLMSATSTRYGINPYRENNLTDVEPCSPRRSEYPCPISPILQHRVFVVSYQIGYLAESWKGYLHNPNRTNPCDQVVEDIDRSPFSYHNTFSRCEFIRDDWWLYYARWTY